MRNHDHIEELIAIRAMGGLDAGDLAELEAEMREHGPDCSECRRLETEYEEVAGRLAFALEPVAVRDGFREQTFELALGEQTTSTRGARRGFLRPLIGVAAAFALFVGGWLIGGAVTGDPEVPANATVIALQGEPGGGTFTAAYQPGEPGLYLLGSNLPALPEDRVYELWLFTGETPASAVCGTPSEDGSLFEFVDTSLEGVGLMAITVETSACPDAPTTDRCSSSSTPRWRGSA